MNNTRENVKSFLRKKSVCAQSLNHAQLFVTPQTVAHQPPLSMEFSRQEYWSGLPFLTPGDLPDPRLEPVSPALAGRFSTAEPPGKPKTKSTDLEFLSRADQE